MARRDSILKHSGSIKNTEKRVSIKQDAPILMEYISEKRPPPKPHSNSNSTITAVTITTSNSSNTLNSLNCSNGGGPFGNNPVSSAARPASLIITKGERPIFKLQRTPSIDHDSDDSKTDNSSTGAVVVVNNKHKDSCDESVPLVIK